jgi:hypothetical protein
LFLLGGWFGCRRIIPREEEEEVHAEAQRRGEKKGKKNKRQNTFVWRNFQFLVLLCELCVFA